MSGQGRRVNGMGAVRGDRSASKDRRTPVRQANWIEEDGEIGQ